MSATSRDALRKRVNGVVMVPQTLAQGKLDSVERQDTRECVVRSCPKQVITIRVSHSV